jgi:hypothetical protein
MASSPVIRQLTTFTTLVYDSFSTLDHFIISGTIFDRCVLRVSVLHDVDNTYDPDALLLQLSLDSKYVKCSEQIFSPRTVWAKFSDGDRVKYRDVLSLYLHDTVLPVDALLGNNATCHNNVIYRLLVNALIL